MKPLSEGSLGLPLLALIALSGIFSAGQPILENYVGRQIPTAMVARNLDRHSGFFHPQLDTGPFPNLFLVEPPIYAACVVAVHRVTSLAIDPCGRLISTFGLGLAMWGLYGVDSRHYGSTWSRFTPLAFFLLPVTIRYGRAFQPDCLALGLVLAGLNQWDQHEERGGGRRLARAWALTALGLATKALTAYALVPLVCVILRPRRPGKVALAASTLLPALAWYAYTAVILRQGGGSRASADNAGNWLATLSLAPLLEARTYATAARMFFWRAYSPVGIALAMISLLVVGRKNRLWFVWAGSACMMLILLAGKIHHEYYWLALAPAVAVGIARVLQAMCVVGTIVQLGRSLLQRWRALDRYSAMQVGEARWLVPDPSNPPRPGSEVKGVLLALVPFALVFLPLLFFGVAARLSTVATPPEWAKWPTAVGAIRANVPRGQWLAAPEALIYLADRKGCRLEYQPKARVRAAGEWGATIDPVNPLALVEFYRSRGARFVADLWPVADEPDRRLLHDAIRRRYKVIVDRDGVILAELVDRD